MTYALPWQVHYEKGVPQRVDVPDSPLYSILRDSARHFPKKTAVRLIFKYLAKGVQIESSLSYRQLDEASDRFAAALYSLGVRQYDRVAIMLPNLPQYTIAFFGILKAG